MPAAHVLSPEVIESAMRRALVLAAQGPEADENPQVGCVILDAAGETVAEGWHLGAGTPHAEVMALSKLPSDAKAEDLTAVVTLEPCNHTGRTGPCAAALVASGIGAVAFGLPDPGEVSGGGAERLRAAGIPVAGGFLEAEGRAFLGPWLARQGGGQRG
ncbi:bifunctional diaminohydroxyphosphoribosylaminopyrimidine deaminase/5-amino-6-(5-phosphoribosylamino)uracil reductase RibD [Leucobacter komagatae]|uniref:bifunctional diaminohydroxyphosphoribosylaminopyrimidine deaminase/5-amino-6-(5-phosphoribosylamino)uracil reductase RibD n=1 Tax=Leucobacter komagatae TaxID=55969 RepID=UPI000ADD0C71|nr:bifunctional diaminohydroxyphosphoribosylaminopyrimidine deaminase/5-amino-6-(5-phosphoribosylamino)uracil reductase RibD [Leucobacter komagatae]